MDTILDFFIKISSLSINRTIEANPTVYEQTNENLDFMEIDHLKIDSTGGSNIDNSIKQKEYL